MKKTLLSISYSLILGLLSTVISADEHLKNPDFSKGLTDWSFHVHKNMSVKRHVSKGILTVQIKAGGESHHVQLIQKISLKEGQRYKLSFDAKRDGKGGKIQVLCMQRGKPWKSYGLNKALMLSDNWSHHEFTFIARGLVKDNPPTIRFFLGNQTGTVQFRKFSLTEQTMSKKNAANGPVITTILGTGLRKEYFNPDDTTIEAVCKELADAGFTMSWATSPVAWTKKNLLDDSQYLAHSKKIAAALRRHGIGVAFGFHWHRLLPNPAKDYPDIYGKKLDPKTSKFIKTKGKWNFGSEKALQKFAKNAKTLFKIIGPIEMFYADEIILSSPGKGCDTKRISTYWTSPTYSVEALKSFQKFLEGKKYPKASQALFPVTTIAVEPSRSANMGLPAISINDTNSDRLLADNNWPDSQLWQYWYEWRNDIYCQWVDTVTTLAWEANKNNKNWMGCYYEMPVHWIVSGLGQDIEKIVKLPHIDYILAGYTTGHRYAKLKQIADAAGKKWGLQVEVSRYKREKGMPVKYIEDTFKNAVNDGASLITCYAGMSFRTDLPKDKVLPNYLKNGWYYMPEQAKAWKSCINWLMQGRGLKAPVFKSKGN